MRSEHHFDEAQAVFSRLKVEDVYEHLGENSRGIVVSSESVIQSLQKLSIDHLGRSDFEVGFALYTTMSMFLGSMDKGGYIRIKGNENSLNMQIRGYYDEDDLATPEGIVHMLKNDNRLEIDMTDTGSTRINLIWDNDAMGDAGGTAILNRANDCFRSLRGDDKDLLVSELVHLVRDVVRESGEFPN